MKLPMWMKEIKWFIQRGKRGYADCDWWNLDSYMSKVMADAILTLRMKGMHVGCGDTWDLESEDARCVHNLYRRIGRFFELHTLFLEEPMLWESEHLCRLYKASGILFIRNFGRLWD